MAGRACVAASGFVWLLAGAAEAAFVPRPDVVIDGAPSKTGATLGDLDGDGNLDILTEAPTIWWGAGDGTFEAGPECDTGMPVVADFDNDGRLDVLRVRDEPVLCRGEGDRAFAIDRTVEASPHTGMHTSGWQIAYAGAAADFDGDGWVDVYVTQYEDVEVGRFFADIVYGNAQGRGLVVAGQVPRALPGRGVAIGDWNGDGDPDVYVSNYRLRENFLFDNDGQGGLREIQEEVGAAGEWAHTISSALGDLDGDGDLDILIGNFSHPGQPGPAVLRNEGEGFVDVPEHGIGWQESYASFALADYDNDGDLDLFITTVYPGDHGRLYRNRGDATFEDATEEAGLGEQTEGYGLALGDIDNDGAIDALIGGLQAAHVFMGAAGEHHWVQLELRGDGSTVNAAAIGARVIVQTDERIVVREVQAGGNGGDRGGSPLRVHMGLGAHAEAVTIEVRWPWAETCTYVRDVDTVSTIEYEPGCDGSADTGASSGDGEPSSTGDGDVSSSGVGSGTTGVDPASSSGEQSTSGDASAGGGEGCGCRRGVPPSWLLLGLLLLVRRRCACYGESCRSSRSSSWRSIPTAERCSRSSSGRGSCRHS